MPASSKIITPCWKKPILHQADMAVTAVCYQVCVWGGGKMGRKGRGLHQTRVKKHTCTGITLDRDGLTSHAGVDTCFDVHSYLVCQDRVLLLSKCLFRRVHRACRCCSEDMISSISPNKTTDSTTESITVLVPGASCPLYFAPHFVKGLL